MATLLDRPPELILDIIDHFGSFWQASPGVFDVQDDRVKTLLNVCLACCTLRCIAQPVLHTIIGVSRRTERDALCTLTQLDRTAHSRPDLVQKTTTLSLKLGGLRSASDAQFFPGCRTRGEAIAEGVLFDLVPLLRNVTSLIWQNDDLRDDFWRRIARTLPSSEDFFPNIQVLIIRPYIQKEPLCTYVR